MKKRLDGYGLECASIIPDTFGDSDYGKGSVSSTDPAVRRKALDYLRSMCEVALQVDCRIVNLWMAQDGYDYLLTADYDREREWMTEAIRGAGFRVPVAEDRVGVQAPRNRATSRTMRAWPIRFWLLRKPAAGTWA